MLRKSLLGLLVVLALIVLHLLAWPVSVEPVAWKAPPNPGYTGPFARNDLLKGVEFLRIGANHGPEDVAVDTQGRIYAATHEGYIVRLQPDGTKPENWVNTQGRPLGIDFDQAGNLIVADAFRGLLSVSPAGKVVELATVADGFPIRYADDVDCAADGRICSQLSKKKSRPSILTTSRRSSPCPLWRAVHPTLSGSRKKQAVISEQ